jgi:hypothetical protein
LGFGVWAQTPNPQSPIPQSPIPNKINYFILIPNTKLPISIYI